MVLRTKNLQTVETKLGVRVLEGAKSVRGVAFLKVEKQKLANRRDEIGGESCERRKATGFEG